MTTKLTFSVNELRKMTEESYRRTVWDVMTPEERDWVLLQLLRNLALATIDRFGDDGISIRRSHVTPEAVAIMSRLQKGDPAEIAAAEAGADT